MPLKPHPTDPDKVIYQSRHYDFPLQGVTTLKREWVELPDKDIKDLYFKYPLALTFQGFKLFIKDIEAKFKEKNT
jgi:hypothetical protein